MAALDIQRRCIAALDELALHREEAAAVMPGLASAFTLVKSIGEFSTFRSDFTAIGGTVNLTARLESQAAAGEILVSAEASAQTPELTAGTATRVLALKGIDHPVLAQWHWTWCHQLPASILKSGARADSTRFRPGLSGGGMQEQEGKLCSRGRV